MLYLKQNTWLLIGALGIAGYFFLKRKAETTAATGVADVAGAALGTMFDPSGILRGGYGLLGDVPKEQTTGLPLPITLRVMVDTLKTAIQQPAQQQAVQRAAVEQKIISQISSANIPVIQTPKFLGLGSLTSSGQYVGVSAPPSILSQASIQANYDASLIKKVSAPVAAYAPGAWQTTITVGQLLAARKAQNNPALTMSQLAGQRR